MHILYIFSVLSGKMHYCSLSLSITPTSVRDRFSIIRSFSSRHRDGKIIQTSLCVCTRGNRNKPEIISSCEMVMLFWCVNCFIMCRSVLAKFHVATGGYLQF